MLPQWLFAKPFEPVWTPPPASLKLEAKQVHVWRSRLDVCPEHLAKWAAYLSADERQRAARFVREHDRQRYIAARGGLRLLLSRYTQCPPEQLTFTYNEYGKPALAESFESASNLAFNLAHSEELALYLIGPAQPLGIDVEAERRTVEFANLWPRITSAAERDRGQFLTPAQQQRVFFQLWTRKEAVIKALGMGLAFSLDSLTVLGTESEQVFGTGEAAALCLQSFCPQPGYWAALAVAGKADCQWYALD